MKRILCMALLFCWCFSHAQIVYEKGYFINNDGIKVSCLIENVDWQYNPKTFNYKFTESGEVKMENIYGVREFGIDNVSMFRRFTVNVERSTMVTNKMTKEKNPQFKEETLFLQAIITGNANLYVLTDENTIKYFFDTKTKNIEQLVFIKYISNDNNRTVDSYEESVKENNLFRQQLLSELKCGSMEESDFSRLKYNKSALSKVFTKYNQCNGSFVAEKNFIEKKGYKAFSLGATVGFYTAKLKVGDPRTAYNVSSDFSGSVIKPGIDFEYILPFNKGSWSIFLSPSYQSFSDEMTFSKYNGLPGGSSKTLEYKASAKYSSIEMPFGVRRYFFVNKSSKIFINLGYVIDRQMSEPQIIYKTADTPSANITIPISSRQNLMFGAGYFYKKFSAELRFNLPRRMIAFSSWNSGYSTMGINLGYKFL